MRRKKLAAAISLALAGSAGAILQTAQAVHINPDGLGEVLIYPYYTVREQELGTTDTLISIVNTTPDVRAVKVRFLEGKNSREVLDFNLYLSKFDVWTGAIVRTDGGAKITTNDTSCTTPPIPADGEEFRTTLFVGQAYDGEPPIDTDDTTAERDAKAQDRVREGYVELIEMGVIDDDFASDDDFNPEFWATHDQSDDPPTPNNCSAINAAWATNGEWTTDSRDAFPDVATPGGLFGGITLVNVNEGTAAAYNAIALDAFLNGELRTDQNRLNGVLHEDPGDILPTLAQADPISSVFVQGGVITSTWFNTNDQITNAGAQAVSAVFMRNNVFNEFVSGGIADARTAAVITLPTKQFHVGVDDPDQTSPDDNDFGPPFTNDFKSGGACEVVGLTAFGREEQEQREDLDFSPAPPTQSNSFCWEVNIVTFNAADPISSDLAVNINTVADNGWVRYTFSDISGNNFPPSDRATNYGGGGTQDGHTMISDDGDVYHGLPVVGFSLQEFINGTLDDGNLISNYDNLFNHSYSRQIDSSS